MKGYNVIVVFNKEADKMLMCKRVKDPYKGLSNFVGGKIEKDENCYDAAYRELFEETSIKKEDIQLSPSSNRMLFLHNFWPYNIIFIIINKAFNFFLFCRFFLYFSNHSHRIN